MKTLSAILYASPNVEIKRDRYGGSGLFAKQKIEKETPAIALPRCFIFTPVNIFTYSHFGQLLLSHFKSIMLEWNGSVVCFHSHCYRFGDDSRDDGIGKDDGELKMELRHFLMLSLIHERFIAASKAYWVEYIQTLPNSYENDPIRWPREEQVQYFEETGLDSFLSHRLQNLIDFQKSVECDSILSSLFSLSKEKEEKKGEWLSGDSFLEALKWASFTLSSRSFIYIPPSSPSPTSSPSQQSHSLFSVSNDHALLNSPCLYPFLDIANHSPFVSVTWSHSDSHVSFTYPTDIEEGEEVVNQYGAKGSEELVIGYGFALDHRGGPDSGSGSGRDTRNRKSNSNSEKDGKEEEEEEESGVSEVSEVSEVEYLRISVRVHDEAVVYYLRRTEKSVRGLIGWFGTMMDNDRTETASYLEKEVMCVREAEGMVDRKLKVFERNLKRTAGEKGNRVYAVRYLQIEVEILLFALDRLRCVFQETMVKLFPVREGYPMHLTFTVDDDMITTAMVHESQLFSSVDGLDAFSLLLLSLLSLVDVPLALVPSAVPDDDEEYRSICEEIYGNVVKVVVAMPHLFKHHALPMSFETVLPYMTYLDQYAFVLDYPKCSTEEEGRIDGVLLVESNIERSCIGNAVFHVSESGETIECAPQVPDTRLCFPVTSALQDEPLVITMTKV